MKKYLYFLVFSSVLFFFTLPVPVIAAVDLPTVGYVHFDTWGPAFYTFSQKQEGSQLPWQNNSTFFAKLLEKNNLDTNKNGQSVMDEKLWNLATAGINYRIFDWYNFAWQSQAGTPDNNASLNYYLSSQKKHNLRFSLMLMFGETGPQDSPTKWTSTVVPKLVQLMKRSEYQKVSGTRPLVYISGSENLNKYFNCGDQNGAYDAATCTDLSLTKAQAAIGVIRSQAQAAGLGNPYLVGLVWSTGSQVVNQYGLDAISTYSTPELNTQYANKSYANQITVDQQFRDGAKAANKYVVPAINLGWDDYPASPAQITTNAESTANWIKQNSASDPTNTLIVYGVNEFSSGDTRIKALAQVFPPLFGDLNGDYKVDFSDYGPFKTNFVSHPYTIYDFNLFVQNFGKVL